MYVGVDFGGTKTLVAVFSEDGEILVRHKFPTEGNYQEYLDLLQNELENLGEHYHVSDSVVLAVPTRIDYDKGTVRLNRKMGDGWGHETIQEDLEKRLGKKVVVENDANVAALQEALNGAGDGYERVLYVTISTGIGTGYVENGALDKSLLRSEGGLMVVRQGDKLVNWESVASGKSFTIKYGKLGEEVDDIDIWKEYAKELAGGFINMMALVQPQIIVVGGGMGAHLSKYVQFLADEITEARDPGVDNVQIVSAENPNDAVLLGCYTLAKSLDDLS